MGFFDIFKKNKSEKETPESSHNGDHAAYRGHWTPVRSGTFNGEKTPGELGGVYKLTPSYQLLRLRAYEAKLTNDTIIIITNKFFKWVVGAGLKLQSEPNENALRTEKIKSIPESFTDDVEARFDVYANSTKGDYQEMENLHEIAAKAFETAFFGDVLIVFRIEGGYPNIQLIDGEHVQTPYLDDKDNWAKKAKERGNIIRNGIELSPKGKHIAYYVLAESPDPGKIKFERIEAWGQKSGIRMAWLYGLKKHRIDNDRFIPVITAVLEKVAKLDRYTEATVGTAEERAKLVYAIEHNRDSNGENPFAQANKVAAGMGKNSATETEGYALGEKTAQAITATTSKTAVNMPIGSKLSAVYAQNEIQYEAFWKAVFKSLCAAVDIPPEVAMQEYNSNYSASRAAINGFEFIIKFFRKKFSEKFYAPFYQLWLHTEILKGNINAPGYLIHSNNFMVREAYGKSRFIGQNLPHIDPVKEVKAVVQMLESELISNEQSTEMLGVGDWKVNYAKLKKEKEIKPDKVEEKPTGGNKLKIAKNG